MAEALALQLGGPVSILNLGAASNLGHFNIDLQAPVLEVEVMVLSDMILQRALKATI